MTVKVRLTAHRGVLVITTVDPDAPHPGWVPIGPGKIGCVLVDTRASLGASAEAIEWLRGVPRSHDAIGDVDWLDYGAKSKVFSWLGGPLALKRRGADGSRNHTVYADDCVTIPNDVPDEARAAIDSTAPENASVGE